jgi:Ca2+-binding RTX toxin-like protein
LSATSVGGNDTIRGGTGTNIMYGDAEVMNGAQGGDDRLIAAVGGGGDTMTGNTGADHFICGKGGTVTDYSAIENDKLSGKCTTLVNALQSSIQTTNE